MSIFGNIGSFLANPFASVGSAAAGLFNPISANLGGLGIGGGLSGGGNNTQTVTSEPPAYLKPYLQDVLGQAQQQYYGGAPQYYPGSTVAGFSPTSQMAQNLISQQALQGSPVNNAATQNITDTLNGNYLYGNPGFNNAFQAAANQIIPQVGSAFGNANRTHSGLAQQAVSQGLGNAFAGLYGQERNNQMQALGMAPTIANQPYYGLNQLANVGQQQDIMGQNQLSDKVNRWNYNQNLPYQQLQRYQGFTTGMPGSTQTTQIPQPGLGQRLLGGGLTGAGFGQMFGASGMGLAPYALGGLALGGLL